MTRRQGDEETRRQGSSNDDALPGSDPGAATRKPVDEELGPLEILPAPVDEELALLVTTLAMSRQPLRRRELAPCCDPCGRPPGETRSRPPW